KRFDSRARAVGVTRAQYRLLAHLGRQEGINQSALADILEIEGMSLGQHIDRLEKGGWVVRRKDPADRRAWNLFLTDKAHLILDDMRALSAQVWEEAQDGLSDDDRERFVKTLMMIKDNLSGADTAVPGVLDDVEDASVARERHVG
ncbi:MAG: MarR family transcriptional regulator, partial [Rhodospirillales bacterium]|nr:MarR family transcriptional regulator [Rhodospirillales bacterium]